MPFCFIASRVHMPPSFTLSPRADFIDVMARRTDFAGIFDYINLQRHQVPRPDAYRDRWYSLQVINFGVASQSAISSA